MNRKTVFLLKWGIFSLVSFALLCFCFLFFGPAISSFIVPSYDDYDYDYYQQQSKFNNLVFNRLSEATKVKITFPRKFLNNAQAIRVAVENPENVELSKQFIQSNSDGWAVWNDYKGQARLETFTLDFYDNSDNYLDSYQIGLNRVIYDSYWKYVQDEKLIPLLQNLGIWDTYEKLKAH
ncbi:MAG: hypothetical protein HC875_37275 [Anaerolineales bacterium]|nr:hypothetical protein [Anaerolineales bacterium]